MQNYHVVKSTKSVGIGILLTLFLGPIGLFYSSVWGGIIMTFSPILLLVAFFLGIFTESEFILAIIGVSLIVYLVFWWLICMIWSAIAVSQYNRRIMKESSYNIPYYPDNRSAPASQPYLQDYTKQLPHQEINQLPGENLNNVVPSIQDWLRANPGKGINDYYVKFRR